MPVDRERVRFWELYGNFRWGVITITQAANYLAGRSKSVELASIGRRTAETEWELLNLIEGQGRLMQDRPSVDELLEAVAGFLRDDVMANTNGRLNFHARVAAQRDRDAAARGWRSKSLRCAGNGTASSTLLGAEVAPGERVRAARGDTPAQRGTFAAHPRWLGR